MTKVLSKKSILQAKWFDVYEVELELPNGVKRTHRDVIRKPSVSIFPLDDEYNLYLIDQFRYLIHGRILESVAGMLDEGEEPLEAAKRELKEETGIEAREWMSLGTQYSGASICTWEKTIYVAKKLTMGQAKLEATEDIKLVKIPLDEAIEKVLHGEFKTETSAYAILKIDKMRQQGKI